MELISAQVQGDRRQTDPKPFQYTKLLDIEKLYQEEVCLGGPEVSLIRTPRSQASLSMPNRNLKMEHRLGKRWDLPKKPKALVLHCRLLEVYEKSLPEKVGFALTRLFWAYWYAMLHYTILDYTILDYTIPYYIIT